MKTLSFLLCAAALAACQSPKQLELLRNANKPQPLTLPPALEAAASEECAEVRRLLQMLREASPPAPAGLIAPPSL